MCSGIAHDPLQRDIFTPIFFGAKIYIPLEEDIGTPGALAKWFAHEQINVTISPSTAMFAGLVDMTVHLNAGCLPYAGDGPIADHS